MGAKNVILENEVVIPNRLRIRSMEMILGRPQHDFHSESKPLFFK